MKRRDLLKAAALGGFVGKDLALGKTRQQDQGAKTPPSDRIRIGMIGV